MASPKCPACSVKGLDFIVSRSSKEKAKGGDAWFDVVFCTKCGHVYGVFTKHVFGSWLTNSNFALAVDRFAQYLLSR